MRNKLLFLLLVGCVQASAQTTVTVISHDSFDVDKKLVAEFEATHKAKVRFVKGGDAGELLNRLILTRKAPLADVVYGLDNSMISRAEKMNLLEAYQSPALKNIPKELYFKGNLMTPVDYGFVAFNYDRAYFKKNKLDLPKSLDDLKLPKYAKLTVVESPATSSPGLAFLLATVNHYGEAKAWDWWNTARKNGMKVARGWSDAYYKDFSKNGGKYPIVLSYSSSPAAEVFYADGFDPKKMPEVSPTANLFLSGSIYHQIEGVGILRGAKQPKLAQKFIDFMLSQKVQADIPTRMWIYPALKGVELNPVFKFADKPQLKAIQSSVLENPQGLVDAWVTNVLRKRKFK